MLTKVQLEYASNRIDAMYRAKVEKLAGNPNGYVDIPYADLIAGIKSGKVKFVERYSMSIRLRNANHVSFDCDVSALIKKSDPKKYDEAVARLSAECERIRDQLYLGDAEKALKMIEAFEKF